MKCASIDIGTNTLRLLIAEADDAGFEPVVYKRAITRLGGGYIDSTGIDAVSAERTFAALSAFQEAIMAHKVDRVFAVATSVVRRAVNREWFLGEVLKRTGLKISVISGDEEARLSLLGVLSAIDTASDKKLVIDIGGGSTEFIFTAGNGGVWARSMEMGVVHLTEKYLKSDPPQKAELDGLEQEIKDVISDLKGLMIRDNADPGEYSGKKGAVFIGTAGTVTTLAAMDQDLKTYDRDRINNYTITKSSVKRMYDYLSGMRLKEREEALALEKGREDLIIPGSAIVFLTMESFGFYDIKVSDAGLLEGLILDRIGTGV